MTQDYAARLNIPVDGDALQTFCLPSGLLFSQGYIRVVIGGRGPYVELRRDQILATLHEAEAKHYYYTELRTEAGYSKVYLQRHRVDYADYVPGLCYVSPFDLRLPDGGLLVKPKHQSKQGDLFGGKR